MNQSLKKFIPLLIILVFMTTICTFGQEEKSVDIEDYRNKRFPGQDLELYNYKDIRIARTNMLSDSEYTFLAYGKKKNNQIFQNGFMTVQLADDFDKAYYTWASDTLANIRLVNSANQKECKVQMAGGWLKEGKNFSLRVVK